MNFILKPNFPKKNVKYIVSDCRIDKTIEAELKNLNISIIKVNEDESLHRPICAHTDIHLFHKGNGEFITSKSYWTYFNKSVERIGNKDICENFNNVCCPEQLHFEYPHDVPLNAVIIGDYLICNTNTVYNDIKLLNKKIISTKQGYTKCSVAPVCENAIITDDVNIYNSVKPYLDVLLIEKGCVELKGYNYGFIGGCAGKLSKEILGFCGDINKCIQKYEIISFCRNHNVECISLSSENLYDYGSLIPIIE